MPSQLAEELIQALNEEIEPWKILGGEVGVGTLSKYLMEDYYGRYQDLTYICSTWKIFSLP